MSENQKWINQTLLTYKDKSYATDGYLRVGILSSTEDYKYFNPPLFSISITNNHQKNYNINIQQAEDLLESFTQVFNQLNGNDSVVEKKYQRNTNIYFRFTVESSNTERIVVIEIISSETDTVKVIIPLKPTFQSLLRRLKSYVEHYDKLCFQLFQTSINYESYQIINQLPQLIKGISSQIVSKMPIESLFSQDKILDNGEDSGAAGKDSEIVDFSINDLDKFMGDNLQNISIPEIDGEKNKIEEIKPVVEIKSKFVEKVLDNNLFNLENKLTSFSVSKIPLIDLATDLQTSLGFDLLPKISEDDKKSVLYISSFLYNLYSKLYTINDQPIPSGTPPLKYKHTGTINEENLELSKDLLLIIGYMRTVRRKLESKINNAYDNKAIIYLFLRCFMDPFCFTFLDNMSKEEVVSSVKNRYLYFDSIGFFDKYKQILTDNNCPVINLEDITYFIEETFEKVIGKTQHIDELHNKFYSNNMIKLPSQNTFNLEQIINEFLPLDVHTHMGIDFKNKNMIDKLKEQYNISDEIFNFFTKKQKVETIVKEKITPLQRWVEKFKQDIPEKYQDEVLEHVKKLKYDKFDFINTNWVLSEFDERIIKALYLWDIENNSEIKTNFTSFATLIENEPMSKENILTTISSNKTTSSMWNDIDI